MAHRVAPTLATVRRPDRACRFPAHGFHEDAGLPRCRRRNQSMDLLSTRWVDPVRQYPRTRAYGFFAKGTVPTSLILTHLVFFHLGFPHRLRPGTSPHALRIPPHGGHPALRSTASSGSRSALAVSSFRLRARLDVSIPSAFFGQRGITPTFGYGTPHSSARGTLTLLSSALLSARYELFRFPDKPGHRTPVEVFQMVGAAPTKPPRFQTDGSDSNLGS